MTEARGSQLRSRRSLALFLIAAVIACALSLLVGISDNPPGIGLLFLSAILLVTAFVHHWTETRRFRWLAIASLIGFPVFAILHNLLYALGELTAGVPVIPMVLEFLHAASFMVALILCPAGLAVGIVGAIATIIRARHQARSRTNHTDD